jgi:ERCC4-type nuclease
MTLYRSHAAEPGVRWAEGSEPLRYRDRKPPAASPLLLYEDTRQQAKLPWPAGVTIERRTLKEADFTTPALLGIAAIELKRGDFPRAVGFDRERFDRELDRLRPYRWKCIVIANDLQRIYRETQVHPHAILGSIASWYARYDVPCLFVGDDAAAARFIAGMLRRWEERITITSEGGAK